MILNKIHDFILEFVTTPEMKKEDNVKSNHRKE
jgi:hypothetical protein